MPEPPIPPDVELRDFQFMPLDVLRLRRSRAWLVCKRRPELAFYMVNLWTAAWHDLPAGSLEDDDDVLADLAMCPPQTWPSVKRDVMRGWVKCSDGRLYHSVVVEKVIEAWDAKLKHAYNRECGRLRKAFDRAGKKGFLPPTFDEWDRQRKYRGEPLTSERLPDLSDGRQEDVNGTSIKCPAENALKGQGQGQGQGQGYLCSRKCPEDVHGTNENVQRTSSRKAEPPQSTENPPDDQVARESFDRVKAAYPAFAGNQSDWLLAERVCRQLIDVGVTWPELEAASTAFASFVAAGGRSDPRFVNLPSKFFGSSLWREEWAPPPTKAEVRQEQNLSAGLAWLKGAEGGE